MTCELVLRLRSHAQQTEIEDFAAELLADAREHLRPGEQLELERVAARSTAET
jgi:hypothetical protein